MGSSSQQNMCDEGDASPSQGRGHEGNDVIQVGGSPSHQE